MFLTGSREVLLLSIGEERFFLFHYPCIVGPLFYPLLDLSNISCHVCAALLPDELICKSTRLKTEKTVEQRIQRKKRDTNG